MAERFVLVHGAWHGGWCWERLAPLLREAGHRVETPDLPGHGRGEPDARISLKTYAEFLAGLLRAGDGRAVLVGHSMGGMAISAAARLAPDRIRTLVHLAAFLPCPGDSVFSLMEENRLAVGPSEVEALMRLSADRRFYTLSGEQVGEVFYEGCGAADMEQAVRRLRPQAVLPLSGRLPGGDGGANPPCVYISTLRDRVIPVAHQRRMASRANCGTLLQLDAGHSPFLSEPEELARILAAV